VASPLRAIQLPYCTGVHTVAFEFYWQRGWRIWLSAMVSKWPGGERANASCFLLDSGSQLPCSGFVADRFVVRKRMENKASNRQTFRMDH
jgi:hypothetical protein